MRQASSRLSRPLTSKIVTFEVFCIALGKNTGAEEVGLETGEPNHGSGQTLGNVEDLHGGLLGKKRSIVYRNRSFRLFKCLISFIKIYM